MIAARAIDGTARLVVTTSLAARLPFAFPNQFGLDEERALEHNKEIISQSTVEDWMPRSFTEGEDGSFGEMSDTLDCSTVAAPSEFAGLGVSWIASIDLHGDGASIGSAGIVSNGDTVYASTTSIYLATVSWDWYQPQVDGEAGDEPHASPDADPQVLARRGRHRFLHRIRRSSRPAVEPVLDERVRGRPARRHDDEQLGRVVGVIVGRASAAARGQRARADRARRWARHERADLRRAIPRHAGLRRHVPPDRSAVRDRSQ